jgi:hydroxymethylbilane synthase
LRKSRRPLIIVSRRSTLARAQAEAVGQALARLHPTVTITYRWIESEGDQSANTPGAPDAPLSEAGGKGLFAGTLEREVLAGTADLAVHSLKDLPARPAPGSKSAGLAIAAIPPRADVRDCLVAQHGAKSIEALPRGATLGTAGPRRAAQVLRLRPDLQIKLIRGNIETRIKKVLEEKQYDATLLAVAGLVRAGLSRHAKHALDTAVMLPAAGQGALALQCRADDHVTLLRCLPLNDPATATAVHVERGIVAALNGDCHSPIAVLALTTPTGVSVRARVLSLDGQTCLEAADESPLRALGKMIKRVVESLQARGAVGVLKGGKML